MFICFLVPPLPYYSGLASSLYCPDQINKALFWLCVSALWGAMYGGAGPQKPFFFWARRRYAY
jgi:hypothetical protein